MFIEILGNKIETFGQFLPFSECNCKNPTIDKLYPNSVYRCENCNCLHTTFTYNCAVNWQCPRELVLGVGYHDSAKQVFIGEICLHCKGTKLI